MARIKGVDTKAERLVRKLLTNLGYRYRLNYRRLRGSPDIAFPRRKKVIWVHGCFWHRHTDCSLARLPKTRLDFWLPKLEGNRLRDQANIRELSDLGWQSLVIWECELKSRQELQTRIKAFLDPLDAGN